MPKFVISYDLRKPDYTEEDYQELYDELDSLGAKHIQDSVWALRSDSSAEEIFDRLWEYMHQKDRLLVAATGQFKNIHGITRFKDA